MRKTIPVARRVLGESDETVGMRSNTAPLARAPAPRLHLREAVATLEDRNGSRACSEARIRRLRLNGLTHAETPAEKPTPTQAGPHPLTEETKAPSAALWRTTETLTAWPTRAHDQLSAPPTTTHPLRRRPLVDRRCRRRAVRRFTATSRAPGSRRRGALLLRASVSRSLTRPYL